MYSVASESGFTPVVLKDLNIQKVTGHNPVESGTRGEKVFGALTHRLRE